MKVIYFYHIPKCGGSYVFYLLKKFCKKLDGEFVPFINLDLNKKNKILDEEFKEFIGSIKDYSKKEVLFIHHHHGYPGIQEMHDEILEAKKAISDKGGEMLIISTVRDPISYSISKVNYLQNKGNDITYEDIITIPTNHNMLSKYLNYNHVDRWLNNPVEVNIPQLEKTISLFDRIFLTEDMDGFNKFLNDFLGTRNITIKKKINKGKLTCLPTEEERNSILELNHIDQHFYDLIKNKMPKKNKFLGFLYSYFPKRSFE